MQAAKSCLFLVFIVLVSTLASGQGIDPIPAPGAAPFPNPGSSPGSPSPSTTSSSVSTSSATSFVTSSPTPSIVTTPKPITLPNPTTASKNCCLNGCQDICSVSFRLPEGDFYLTTINNNYLQFLTASLPNPVSTPTQQFILTRNPDCTWSIRSRSNGQYISNLNSNGGSWLSFRPSISMTEKWYLQSHEDHIHIQSASALKSYWQFDSSYFLNMLRGKAVAFKMEFFPCDYLFGWN